MTHDGLIMNTCGQPYPTCGLGQNPHICYFLHLQYLCYNGPTACVQ